MNRFLAIVALSFIAGCGSSGGEPVFGGFTPTGGSALIFAPTTCDIAYVGSTAVSGIALDFTSYADSCGVINETQLCGNKASATRVLAVVMSGEVGGASIDPVEPGTYSYLKDPPTSTFKAIIGQAAQDDASCDPLSDDSLLDITGGTVTISSVSETKVIGSTNIRFQNGQVFKHSFELPLCVGTIDLCTRFSKCTSYPCVQ